MIRLQLVVNDGNAAGPAYTDVFAKYPRQDRQRGERG